MSADRELVEAVLAGGRGAFARLVQAYQGLVWRIVFRLVRDAEDARELAQETFLRVHRQLGQFRHDSSLKTWIGRVAWSIALRHLERNRIPIEANAGRDDEDGLDAIAHSPEDVEQACSEAQAAAVVRRAVEALPPVQRTLVALYHLEELPIADIAGMTGLPVNTIKSHLFRARLQLRQALAAPLGVEA